VNAAIVAGGSPHGKSSSFSTRGKKADNGITPARSRTADDAAADHENIDFLAFEALSSIEERIGFRGPALNVI
jgi:hypothetical protein